MFSIISLFNTVLVFYFQIFPLMLRNTKYFHSLKMLIEAYVYISFVNNWTKLFFFVYIFYATSENLWKTDIMLL